jgi:hypothetical protein
MANAPHANFSPVHLPRLYRANSACVDFFEGRALRRAKIAYTLIAS